MPLQVLTRELVEEIAHQYPALQSLNLSKNALREVQHLALLPRLLRVDLSGNRLRAFPAPEALGTCCPRLEFIDLSANAIESLLHVGACENLRALDLGGNRIELFSELRFLQSLEHLEALTLQGNPIAQHATYRQEVLSVLPQLKSLDDKEVTPAERLYLRLQRKTDLQGSPVALSPVVPPPIQTQSIYSAVSTWQEPVVNGKLHLSMTDAAVSPVSSSLLLTPDNIERQRHQQVTITRRPHPPDSKHEANEANLGTHSQKPSQVRSLHVDIAASAMTPTRSRHSGARDAPGNSKQQLQVMAGAKASATAVIGEQSRLLQSRVTALESILSIQDKAIHRGLVEVGQTQASVNPDPKENVGVVVENAAHLYVQLLSTWREKVVSLMVQMKSMDLTRHDDSRRFQRQIDETEAVGAQLEQERELWKQKHADAEAQRDLERVRFQESQIQRAIAETKAVSAVRMLSVEREKLQQVASAVALFSARDGSMVGNIENLYAVARRLEALERRLHYLGERIKTAASLVAHREARLRNSEAAIDAERRIWNHRFEQMKEKRSLGETQSSSNFGLSVGDEKSRLKRGGNGARSRFLRPATEAAFRELFHRLDPYDTGLVRAQALLDTLRVNASVLNAVGGQEKHGKLIAHIEKAIRQRSIYGTIGGNLTWGELLLFFMPESSEDTEDLHWDDGGKDDLSSIPIIKTVDDDVAALPPPFQSDVNAKSAKVAASSSQRRLEKKVLDSMTREELVRQVLYLQEDRNQLAKRVLEDARELRRRAISIQNEWKGKVEQLVAKNEELQRGLSKQQQTTQCLMSELEQAERDHGEAIHQLESFRRELLVKESEFTQRKEELETQRTESLLREQEIWQKELQDVNFSHSLLKTENQKQELYIQQLERELSKRNDALVANETQKVAHLEDKLRKRDTEIAKLRRERNTILGTLRENERKLALQRAVVTESMGTQTEQDIPPSSQTPDVRSVGCQTTERSQKQLVQSSDLRMNIDEIAEPRSACVHHESEKTAEQLMQEEISQRLSQLQSLTEDLLDD